MTLTLVGLALALGGCGQKSGGAAETGSGTTDTAGGAEETGLSPVEGTGDGGVDHGTLDTSTGTFDCGDKVCIAVYEYCYAVVSGAGGDTEYSCPLTPDACVPEPDCSCLIDQGAVDGMLESCSQDGDGNLFVELDLP